MNWFNAGLGAVAAAVGLFLFARLRRRRQKRADLGSVSEAWLASHRARRDQDYNG
jgi:hypothetical protein